MAWPDDNYFQSLTQIQDPSFMRQPVYSNVLAQPQAAPPPGAARYDAVNGYTDGSTPPQARRRASVIDILGGLADSVAQIGGVDAGYQPTLDAATERRRQAEGDQMARQEFGLKQQKYGSDIANSNSEVASRRAKLLGPLAAKMQDIYKAGGAPALEKTLPVAYQMLGLSPEEAQQYHAQIMADPENTLPMLASLGASENETKYGLGAPVKMVRRNADGSIAETQLLQPSSAGGFQAKSLGPEWEIADPLQFVDEGPQTSVRSRRTGQEVGPAIAIGGKPETGYIQTPSADGTPSGQFAPAPGSDAEAQARVAEEKRQADLAAEQRGKKTTLRQADIVLDKIGAAEELTKKFGTTGFFSKAMQYVPGTAGYDMATTLDTIRANVGFDALQQMRDNSPTGGALGQVSERENTLLQSVLTSLDMAQSDKQFKASLEQLKRVYGDIVNGTKEQQAALRKRQETSIRGGQSAPKTDGGWKYLGPKK